MEHQHSLIFYDGQCGLCHRSVLFALRHDRDGSRFRFAPLQGETIRRELSTDTIANLPDSLVVLGRDGTVLQESQAVLSMLHHIGGAWGVFGQVLSWVPTLLRDAGYRAIARARHRLFSTPPEMCPVVSEDLKARFLP